MCKESCPNSGIWLYKEFICDEDTNDIENAYFSWAKDDDDCCTCDLKSFQRETNFATIIYGLFNYNTQNAQFHLEINFPHILKSIQINSLNIFNVDKIFETLLEHDLLDLTDEDEDHYEEDHYENFSPRREFLSNEDALKILRDEIEESKSLYSEFDEFAIEFDSPLLKLKQIISSELSKDFEAEANKISNRREQIKNIVESALENVGHGELVKEIDYCVKSDERSAIRSRCYERVY